MTINCQIQKYLFSLVSENKFLDKKKITQNFRFLHTEVQFMHLFIYLHYFDIKLNGLLHFKLLSFSLKFKFSTFFISSNVFILENTISIYIRKVFKGLVRKRQSV